MEIFINNEKLDVEIEKDDSLESILNSIESFVESKGKIIEEILLNGEEHKKENTIDVTDISMIEVKVISPRILALESLREMDVYLEKVIVGIDSILNYLEDSEEKKAMDIVVELINGMEWIYNIFDKIEKIMVIDYSEIEFIEIFNSYKDILEKILESLEKKDFIMLADILNYELKDNLDLISAILPNIYNFILEEEKLEQQKC